jgi:hypothetical protein
MSSSDRNRPPHPVEGSVPRSYLLTTSGVANALFSRCWSSQTLEAYSEKFNRTVWILIPCNQWKCRQCAIHKIQKLASRTNAARPNRLLTLTIDPSLWETPRNAFDGTRRQVPELIRRLRVKFGEVEYLRVTELTARGWPHYHLLVRSGFIPHSVVKTFWSELTGATIVDLRQVKNRFQTYIYLVKYLAKMHTLGWTNRHVSTSRKFFPPEDPKPKNPHRLKNKTFVAQRPGNYLYAMYRGATITELAYGVFGLLRPDDPEPIYYRAVLATPPTVVPPLPYKPVQQELPFYPEGKQPPCPTQPSASPALPRKSSMKSTSKNSTRSTTPFLPPSTPPSSSSLTKASRPSEQ